MANLVITSTTNCVKVVFNDFATVAGMVELTLRKDKITAFELTTTLIRVHIANTPEWRVSLDGTDSSLRIDTIDSATPSSLSDLHTKLSTLLG